MNTQILRDQPEKFIEDYYAFAAHLEGNVDLFVDRIDQSGNHPYDYREFETAFAACHIRRCSPESILDIGSRRTFLAGVACYYDLLSVDIRPRPAAFAGERVIVGDAGRIPLPDDSCDFVLSLNAVEHFGLGRYGDQINPNADRLAFVEWRRILKPGGVLLFSTTISSNGFAVAFNAHRVYGLQNLKVMLDGFLLVEEKFFCNSRNEVVNFENLNTPHRGWDVYAGCYLKAGK
jgi:SAM-dependent methyltransferase